MKDFNQQLINSRTKFSVSGTFFSAGTNINMIWLIF
jgi:hypothetical protein